MTTIQPVLPVVNAAPPPSAGGTGKAEAGTAIDFLSMVVDAADEQTPAAEGEGIAGPVIEESDDGLEESTEGLLAASVVPVTLPEPLPVAAGQIDAPREAEAGVLPAPATLLTTSAPAEDALAFAAKAKAVNDVLLQAQTPTAAADAAAETATPDAALQATAATADGEETKATKEQPAALPGSLLSMKETPEQTAEALPAALAFRKALDQRSQSERTRETSTEAARSESTTVSARNDGKAPDADAALRMQSQTQTAPVVGESEGEAKPLDALVRHGGGESAFDTLLAGKSGDAKHANAAATLTAVRSVLVNPQAVVAQVAVQLTAAGKAKTQAMTVKLEPIELGKIDIRLDFGTDGKVQASIVAERPQTLDMLQRDARGLEKALQAAGLQTDSGSLSFNLRGQDRQQAQGDQRPSFSASSGDDGDAGFGSETFSVIAGQPRTAPLGRVDMLL